jgi:hypothetical protein
MNIAKAVILMTILCTIHSALGQQVSKADHLAPEDLGAYKWILSGTASTNEVVVFRRTRTTTHGDTVIQRDVLDCVHRCHIPDTRVEEAVLYYDANFFKDTIEERWRFKGLGAVGGVSGDIQRCSSDGRIAFKDGISKGTLQTIVYEVLIMSYSEAKQIHPDLPPIEPNKGWTGNFTHREKPIPQD